MTRWRAHLASPRVVMAAATGGLVALASAGTALLVLTGTSAVAPPTSAVPPLPAERPASAAPGVVVVPSPAQRPPVTNSVVPRTPEDLPVLAFVPEDLPTAPPVTVPGLPEAPDARPPVPTPIAPPAPLPAVGRDDDGKDDGKKAKKAKKVKQQHGSHDDERHAVEQPTTQARKHAPADPAAKTTRGTAPARHRADRYDD